jgi:hypothetical protein
LEFNVRTAQGFRNAHEADVAEMAPRGEGLSSGGFTPGAIGGIMRHARGGRQKKITFAEMRSTGVRGILIYCANFHCSHSIAVSGDRWPDHVRLSDLEPRFICKGLREERS